MLKLFISHSSRDMSAVEALIDLLRVALRLSAREIRCTSLDGYRFEGGADTDEQLRVEVHSAQAFLGVISSASVESMYVLFELGARWGINKHLLPLLAPGTSPSLLGGPLKGLNALRMDSAAQLHQLVDDLATVLNTAPESPSAYQKHLEVVLSLPKDDAPVSDPPATQEHQRKKYYFLSGCGVGNKIAILPLPPGGDDGGFAEFLDYLQKAGLSDNDAYEKIARVQQIRETVANDHDGTKSTIEDYFDAMNSIAEIAQASGSDQEFAWFNLGRLLYDVPTLLLTVEKDTPESVGSLLTALEVSAEQLEFPTTIRKQILEFVAEGRENADGERLLLKSNELCRAIYRCL